LAGFLGARKRLGGRAIPWLREPTRQNRPYRPAGAELNSAQLSAGKTPPCICFAMDAGLRFGAFSIELEKPRPHAKKMLTLDNATIAMTNSNMEPSSNNQSRY
jgi:hypothetical protein